MATYARPTIGIDADRLFFSGMAAAIAATIFAGFAPTYYLYPWLHGVTSRGVPGGASLTPLVHVHALVGSLWIILFITQVGLIARRRHDLHRKLGAASLFLAAALIVIGYLTAVDAARAGSSPPGWDDKAFLLIPLSSLVLFGSFVAAGALNRHRPDRLTSRASARFIRSQSGARSFSCSRGPHGSGSATQMLGRISPASSLAELSARSPFHPNQT